MDNEKNTAVVTVLGKDRVGIIAGISNLLLEYGININDISQTILDDIFTMVMLVDLKDLQIENSDISDRLMQAVYDEFSFDGPCETSQRLVYAVRKESYE